MKLTLTRDALLDAVLTTARALSTRTALPSLGGIMLDASGDAVVAKATDTEMSLTTPLTVEVEAAGAYLLPGRLLVEVVRALPEGPVEIEARGEESDVEIRGGSARFHLRTLDTSDFPPLPTPGESPFSLPAAPMAETIDRVATAASRDEVRPILTGILISAEESRLTMVATDSYRLAVKHTELEQPVGESVEATVPARALRELARLTDNAELDSVQISMPGNQIVFEAGGTVLASRLIDGQFPSYKQLLPESFAHDVKLDRSEFLDVTRRVRHLAQRQVPLRLSLSEGELEVSAETPEVGDARDAMPASFDGEPLEIAFNPQFLIDGIESVTSEQILLRLSSPLRPGLLEEPGVDDFRYLVMPIRLNA